MGKIRLQMHMTLDGFVGKKNGDMDCMVFDLDDELKNFIIASLDEMDSILLAVPHNGDATFITYWTSVAENPDDQNYSLGKKIAQTPKIVFTQSKKNLEFPNTTVIKGKIVDEVKRIKKQKRGKNMMVFGGARFASALIEHQLVNEFHILSNPVAIGDGLSIFKKVEGKQAMKLVESKAFDCGITVLQYESKK